MTDKARVRVGTTVLMPMPVHKRISPAKVTTEKVWVICAAKVIKVIDADTVVVRATYDDWGEIKTHTAVFTKENILALQQEGINFDGPNNT